MKELLKSLIRAKSTEETGELAVAELISAQFAKSQIDSVVDTWDENRANITAHIKSTGKKPALLFLCHLDVVGPGKAKWQYEPFDAVEADGKIHGRGAADMKGGIAATVTAITELLAEKVELQGDIIFVAAAGEESDSCGAKRFIENFDAKGLAGVVVPEPTDFEVVTAHRGLLWLEITTIGKTAHGSMPQLGINAIKSMAVLLEELEEYAKTGLGENCSMSVNKIAGGKAINVVPDRCTVGIDIRTGAKRSHTGIFDDVQGIVAKLKRENADFDAEISIARDLDALYTDSDCDFVKNFCDVVGANNTKAVGFCTDGPFVAALGLEVLIFGPGNPELCHKPNEYIEIDDLEKAVRYYKNIILKFLT